MELSSWLSLLAVCTAGAMSPGPSAAVIIDISIRQGRQHGLAAAIAHGLGVGCYALMASLGLGLIITNDPLVFNSLKWLGAAFLLYLGLRAIGFKLTPSANNHPESEPQLESRSSSLLVSARTGFFVAILNPKVALFFLALFSQFIDTGAGTGERLLMAATATGVDILWYMLVASAVTTASVDDRFSAYGPMLEKLFGVLIIAVAIKVAAG
jgi:threonine/homoserine/homoserine lactone efflux protein